MRNRSRSEWGVLGALAGLAILRLRPYDIDDVVEAGGVVGRPQARSRRRVRASRSPLAAPRPTATCSAASRETSPPGSSARSRAKCSCQRSSRKRCGLRGLISSIVNSAADGTPEDVLTSVRDTLRGWAGSGQNDVGGTYRVGIDAQLVK